MTTVCMCVCVCVCVCMCVWVGVGMCERSFKQECIPVGCVPAAH